MRAIAATVAGCFLLLEVACSSASAPSPVQGDGGIVGDGGTVQPAPAHWACSGEAGASGACLSGTATTKGFAVQPHNLYAELYRIFPLGSETPDQKETVATDGTWAFDGVSAWSHYFVRIVADFGQSPAVATFAGPLSVPSTGGPVAVTVKPVQAVASEHGTGGSYVIDWASAEVFDPSSAAELQSSAATVSIAVGAAATSMPWTTTPQGMQEEGLYFVQFGMPPAAQASYTITASGQAFGSTPASWTLVPSPPSFMPTITSPTNQMKVSAGALAVSWPAQAAADYVTVALFEVTDGGVTAVGANPPPQMSPDTTSQMISIPSPGSYVVDVYFTTAACPTTADGCVLSSAVAAAQITAQ